MRLLVSSAKGANGAGYGAILAFDFAGNASGPFYVNNGNKRVLALDQKGQVLKTPARSSSAAVIIDIAVRRIGRQMRPEPAF